MPNFFVTFADDVAVDAKKALTFLTTEETKLTAVEPAVKAALGALATDVSTALEDTSAAASSSFVNIAMDMATFTALKSCWGDVTKFLTAIGVKAGAATPATTSTAQVAATATPVTVTTAAPEAVKVQLPANFHA
jgi:hypothetical protein